MQPAPVGTRIRVLRNEFNHSYTIGGVYTVTHVDTDGTFKAVDENGRVGNWLRWSECMPEGPSVWTKLAADLPEPLARFLACFDGIGHLTLKEAVIDAVLSKLPDLHERILAAAATSAGEAVTSVHMPARTQKQRRKQDQQSQ